MTQLGVFNDSFYNSACVLPQAGVVPTTQATGTVLAASTMVGAQDQYVLASGQAAVAWTTDSAANIIAQLQATLAVQNAAAGNAQGVQPNGVPNLTLLSYTLTINNTNSATITLTGGAGVTISGTNTLLTNVARTFVVKVTSPTTVTMTNVASGTP